MKTCFIKWWGKKCILATKGRYAMGHSLGAWDNYVNWETNPLLSWVSVKPIRLLLGPDVHINNPINDSFELNIYLQIKLNKTTGLLVSINKSATKKKKKHHPIVMWFKSMPSFFKNICDQQDKTVL